MKIKAMVLLAVLILAGGNLYAANGDLTVNGNLTVSTTGITFSDGSVQNTAKRLVCDVLVSAATSSVSCPGLDGSAHGGYDFEFVIVGNSSPIIRVYVNDDSTNGNYSWRNCTNGLNFAGSDAILVGNAGNNSPAVNVQGGITFSPSGVVLVNFGFQIPSQGATGTGWIYKTAAVANLTQLKISSSVSNGIGANSRFRLWRRN